MQNVYGQKFVLLESLNNVECWNSTRGSTASFAVGETITVVQVYDAFHTTILCAEEDGRPLTNADGTPDMHRIGKNSYPTHGYRFIVNNLVLGRAIGVDMPEKTRDLVGEIIRYEDGEATDEETAELFAELRESGLGRQLQGHYSSRM